MRVRALDLAGILAMILVFGLAVVYPFLEVR